MPFLTKLILSPNSWEDGLYENLSYWLAHFLFAENICQIVHKLSYQPLWDTPNRPPTRNGWFTYFLESGLS